MASEKIQRPIIAIRHTFQNTGSVAAGTAKALTESISDEIPSGYKAIAALPTYSGSSPFCWVSANINGNGDAVVMIRNTGSTADSGTPSSVILCVPI